MLTALLSVFMMSLGLDSWSSISYTPYSVAQVCGLKLSCSFLPTGSSIRVNSSGAIRAGASVWKVKTAASGISWSAVLANIWRL